MVKGDELDNESSDNKIVPSRLERERKKVKTAKENIAKIIASERKKRSKQDTQQKILLGVMFKKMIDDKIVRAETFTKYSQSMTDRDRGIVENYWASLNREKVKE